MSLTYCAVGLSAPSKDNPSKWPSLLIFFSKTLNFGNIIYNIGPLKYGINIK